MRYKKFLLIKNNFLILNDKGCTVKYISAKNMRTN